MSPIWILILLVACFAKKNEQLLSVCARCRASRNSIPLLRRDDMRFAILLPVSVKCLSCDRIEGTCPDLALAPLTRLTQLEALDLTHFPQLTQPLPQLPSLLSLHMKTDYLPDVASVAMTLQELHWSAPRIDFSPPNTLAHFTRLHILVATGFTIHSLSPEVLPLSLGYISLCCEAANAIDADHLELPAGGHIVKSCIDGRRQMVVWARL